MAGCVEVRSGNGGLDNSTGATMTYKEVIANECEKYAKEPGAVFIGYNTVFGSRMYGTLSGVAEHKCLETPVAENLMAGMAVGMALQGMRPVVCFERHDFMLLALDALVNHMDKLSVISGSQFKLPVIVRAIVGGRTPIDPGPMHSQNYAMPLTRMFKNTPVLSPASARDIEEAWNMVGKTTSGAVVIIEHKDHYNIELPPASPPN